MQVNFEAITAKSDSDGIIRNVSVVTVGEAKTHNIWVDGESLAMFSKLCSDFPNGVKVKSKHKTSFDAIVGSLKNFHVEGEKLLADLHLIKSHAQFSHIIELSEKLPGEFGLSASFEYSKENKGGKDFIRPSKIGSVDLVDDPAANPNGLFSKVDNEDTTMDEKTFSETIKGWFSKAEKGLIPVEALSAVQTEVTTLKAQLEAKGGELSTKQTELSAALSKVTDLEKKFTDAEATHTAALAAKELEVETRASAKAIEFAAAQGIKPLKADQSKESDSGNFTEKCLANKGK